MMVRYLQGNTQPKIVNKSDHHCEVVGVNIKRRDSENKWKGLNAHRRSDQAASRIRSVPSMKHRINTLPMTPHVIILHAPHLP